jgi:ribA/ribD-fused uncharacterized protein
MAGRIFEYVASSDIPQPINQPCRTGGPSPGADAPITSFRGPYRFLSNFAPFPVVFDGIEYPTAEHAYVAAKTLDPTIRAMVRGIDKPGNAKYRGKSITVRPDWDDVRQELMLAILRSKFSRNGDARDLLLATGDAQLVEGNAWHDNYWGHCRCKECTNTVEGHNMLGRLLMTVRDELRHPTTQHDQ